MDAFLLSLLSDLAANAIVGAAEKGVVHLNEKEEEQIRKLTGAVQSLRSSEGHLDAGLSEAFRSLAPIQSYNRFNCLFNDLAFRQTMLKWMFALSEEERKATADELRTLASSGLETSWRDKAVDVLMRSFETLVHSNTLLSGLLNRADHERLLQAAMETAHKVDLRFADASAQLSRVLEEITKLRAAPAGVIPEPSIAHYRQEFGRFTENTLRDLRLDLPVIGSIDRIEVSQALQFALREQAILLLGEAGTGKTGVMARLAHELKQRGECVLFVPADGIARQFSGSCTVADLSDALGFDRPLPDILGAIADAAGRVWLLVDQLDTAAGEPVGGAFVQLLKLMRGRTGCVVVAACRSYEAEFSADVSTIKLPTLHVAQLPPEEVCRCLGILKLVPTADLVGFCGNLLNLSLLAALAQEGAALADVTVEAQLWRALREHLGTRSQGSLLDFVCDCAIWSARSPAGDFSTEAVAQADRLASFGVLNRMASGRYRFRHERLRNYFVAYDSVMRRRESLPALLARVPAARSKTIVPWMVQIADCEAPHYLDHLFVDGFDQNLVPSTFPRQALSHSLPLVLNPTPSLALVIWRIALEHDDESRRHDSLCAEVPEKSEWAEAFWDAKVFDLASMIMPSGVGHGAADAVLKLLPLVAQRSPERILAWIDGLQAPPTNLTGICSVLLKAPAPQLKAGMSKVLNWWERSDGEITLGDLDRIPQPGEYNTTLVIGLFGLAERLEKDGEHQMAVRLIGAATTPVLRPWNQPASSEDCYLTARYRDTFLPPDEDDDKCHFATKFRIPPTDLVGIFRGHIQSIKAIAQRHSFVGWCDPYGSWAKVRQLFAPGRKDRGQEWQIWYGALLAAARATLKSDMRAGVECVRGLLGSSDVLEVRIGLYLLAGLHRIPRDLLTLALSRGYFREPAAIGEAILIFDRFRTRKNPGLAIALASELRAAIQNLDRDHPDHLSLDSRMSHRLLRWADTVALEETQGIDENCTVLARFILALGDLHHIRCWSFDRLARFCEICAESNIRPTGRVYICDSNHTELFDCTPHWNSLHTAAEHVDLYALHSRFESLLKVGCAQGTEWVAKPIGYAMLLAAQRWFSDYAKSLYEEKSEDALWKPKVQRPPSERKLRARVLDLLRTYQDAVHLEGGISPAIRAQFAGLLSLFSRRLPDHILSEMMPTLRPALRALVTCKEAGCVRSWGQVFQNVSQPMSTASVALLRLITLAWRERYGNKSAVEVQLSLSRDNQEDTSQREKALVPADRQAVVSAMDQVATGSIEIAGVFGFCFAELLMLDPAVANEVLQTVLRQGSKLVQAFADGLSKDESAWLLFRGLRSIYEHVIRDESATVSNNIVQHLACAYLVGWEELQGEKSLLAHIRRTCKPDDKAALVEIVCDAFDSLGRDASAWPRVRALWQLASDEAGSESTRELGAFWRCLQQGRKTIGDDKAVVKLHVPEAVETLAPLLERTCAALATDPGYSTDKREAVARYLAAQSVGHEMIAVRLLGLCLGVHTKDYANIVVDYHEEAREVLRNAVSVGGKARKLATEIIERHELESDKSLAGLLL